MQGSTSGPQQPDVELGSVPCSKGPAAPQAGMEMVLGSKRQDAVSWICDAAGKDTFLAMLLHEQQPPPPQQDSVTAAAGSTLNEGKPEASTPIPAVGSPAAGGSVGRQAGKPLGNDAGLSKDERTPHSNAGSAADGQAGINGGGHTSSGKASSREGSLMGSQQFPQVDQQQRIAEVLEALLTKMNTWPPPPPRPVAVPPAPRPTMLELYKKGTDNSILVAILVATVAFTGFVAPPGGAGASGRANATSDAAASGVQAALVVFMYSDALAFGLSLISSMICFMGMPAANDEINWKARWGFIGFFVWFSAFFLAVAFLAAGYISFATGGFKVHWIVITTFVPGIIAFFALLFLVQACCSFCATCCCSCCVFGVGSVSW